MSLLTSFFDSRAARKENKLKQKLLDKGADISRAEFDKRMSEILASDARLLDLSQKGYTDAAANEDATFADLLTNAQVGFDEQSTIVDETAAERMGVQKSAFDQQMEALGGLMTAQRGARLKMQEASAAERERQQALQGQADELADALPEQIGFNAQEQARQKAFADRLSLINETTTAPTGPAWAKGAAGAYANADAAATAVGQGDAAAAARVSSYGDAFQGSERTMGGFADDIAGLTRKAELSRSALPAELGVGKLEGEQAKERADFAVALAKEMGDRRDKIAADRGEGRTATSKTFRGALGSARESFGTRRGSSIDNLYDRLFSAESGYISGVSGSSQNLENKLVGLNNFKMGNTTVTSGVANALREVEAAVKAAYGMPGGG